MYIMYEWGIEEIKRQLDDEVARLFLCGELITHNDIPSKYIWVMLDNMFQSMNYCICMKLIPYFTPSLSTWILSRHIDAIMLSFTSNS